jgi:choline dehydrogenase-like flavoprotein
MSSTPAEETFINTNPHKQWVYHPGFGGGSNSWWAAVPRMLPNDFKMNATYGVGLDWPLNYDDLEEYYYQAEVIMAASGPDDGSPAPRSQPYPQPPHRFTDPDRLLKAAYPDLYFQQPTARARRATAHRPACCASGVCSICPANAKFTILNEMAGLYEDERLTLKLGATAQTVEVAAKVATGVTYLEAGKVQTAQADLVILGANALFNPHILLRSELNHPLLGKRLHEQISVDVNIDLAGLDNYQGSTSITANGYMLYDGPHRAQRAGCLIESFNIPRLRAERGKWRQHLRLKFIFEDLPSEANYVRVNPAEPTLAETIYTGYSDYAQRGLEALPDLLPKLLEPLPIEQVSIANDVNDTEAHIQGTTVMGDDPQTSIVDKYLVHHQVRNLVVLGSSVFPTGAPANPTLTLSALSLWSAAHLLS